MKLNKKKLIALGLSAIMCVGPFSSVSYAEELSDGSEEIIESIESTDEEVVFEQDSIEVVEASEDAGTTGFVFDKTTCPVKFIHPGDDDYEAKDGKVYKADAENIICIFNLTNAEGEWKSVKATKIEKKQNSEVAKATCKKDAGYIPVASYKFGDTGEIISAEDAFYVTAKATGHSFTLGKTVTQNFDIEGVSYDVCTQPGYQITFYACDDCGASGADFVKSVGEEGNITWNTPTKDTRDAVLAQDSNVKSIVWIPEKGHNFGSPSATYYLLGDNVKGDLEQGIKATGDLATLVGTERLVYTRVPVVVDTRFNAFYQIVDQKTCSRCGKTMWEYRENKANNSYIFPIYTDLHRFYDVEPYENVATIEKGENNKNVTVNGIDDQYVWLLDCTKPGKYTLNTYGLNADGSRTRISTEIKTVSAHHHLVVAGVEFASDADVKNAVVTWKNGIPTVTNKECTKTLTYKILYRCNNIETYGSAAKCNLKAETHKKVVLPGKGSNEVTASVSIPYFKEAVSQTAALGNNHVLVQNVYNDAFWANKYNYYIDVESDLWRDYEFDDSKDVKLVNKTYTCEKAGTVDVQFYCTKCHKLIETITVNVKAPKHIRLEPKKENEVAATCSADGSYTATVYCKRCNAVLEDRKTVIVNRTPHTNEMNDPKGGFRDDEGVVHYNPKHIKDITPKFEFVGDVVVDTNASLLSRIGKTLNQNTVGVRTSLDTGVRQDYCVKANVYSECEVCGEKIDYPTYGDVSVSIKIEDAKSQGKACQPGSITLSAVATYYDKDNKAQTMTLESKTFEYYTSINAFQGKTAHNYGQPVIENLKEDGSYDEVYYCTICGEAVKVDHHDAVVEPEDTRPAKTVVYRLMDEGDGTMRVWWRSVEGVAGVQFAWATDEEFTDAKYSVETRTNNQRRYGLERATYYVKARTYVIGEDGKRVYSKWSGTKSIDIVRNLAAPTAVNMIDRGNGSVGFEVTPVSRADGYQICYADGKTASFAKTSFIRKLGSGTHDVKIRAYAEGDDGRYYSAWVDAGTVTVE